MTFWEHLEELRQCLIRILIATLVCTIVVFFFYEPIFQLIFYPSHAEFPTFGFISKWVNSFHIESLQLINTGIANQFLVHLRVSLCVGLICVAPYILYVLLGFISPALYQAERRMARRLVVGGYALFVCGLLLNYFIIFPFSVMFLGQYHVSQEIVNMIDLDSYIGMFLMLSFLIGLMFELPLFCVLLSRVGLIDAQMLRQFRKHVFVVILILAAVITPTGDPFTLMLVALPIYLLYELSILII